MESEIGMFQGEAQASVIKKEFEQYLGKIDEEAKKNGRVRVGATAFWYPQYFLEMGKDLKFLDKKKYSYLKDNFFEYNSKDYREIFQKITNLSENKILEIINGKSLKNNKEFMELNKRYQNLQNKKRSKPDKPKAGHNVGGIPSLGSLMRKLLQFHFYNGEISTSPKGGAFPLNQIFYGPSGTGKTYNTVNKALEIICGKDFIKGKKRVELKNKFNNLAKKEQIVFITFHQSMSYEDFIEGIKPKLSENQDEDSKISYEIKPGIFRKICARAKVDPENNYILIIDEINRGDVSQIFGELITLIEEDKRLGRNEELIVTLPYSKDDEGKFGVPDNIYIIGTMNTADRSVEALDTALRRRFSFIEMMPYYELEGLKRYKDIDLPLLLEKINKRIEKLLDREHQIGHSYFLKVEDLEGLRRVFKDNILPLLQEYFFGDYGKIGKVLGKKFVEKIPEKETEFADFDYEIEGKDVYKLKDPFEKTEEGDYELTIGDFKSIYE